MAASICAVVPCDARHLRIVHEAIESLAVQTLAPTTISLRFSSMHFCPVRPKRLRHIRNLFTECTTKSESLGVVRDEAVKACRGEEYITYLDGDDVALPYALERMIALMRERNASVGLHDYFGKQLGHPVKNHSQLVPYFRADTLPPFALHAHMAHSTMHRSVMISHHNITIGEDSRFIRDMWNRNATFVYTAERLTRYLDRSPRPSKKTHPRPLRHRKSFSYKRLPLWLNCFFVIVGGLMGTGLSVILARSLRVWCS